MALPVKDTLWMKDDRKWTDPKFMEQEILRMLVERVGKNPKYAEPHEWYTAVSNILARLLNRQEVITHKERHEKKFKRVYYLSLEYLMGRHMEKVLVDLDLKETVQKAFDKLGVDYKEVVESEPDPALGNGGLGRLAACFLDSLATHGYPGYGYGIRYEYGMFNQEIRDGKQIEHPENWLRNGNPWETCRPQVSYRVNFFGRVDVHKDENGREHRTWVDTERVTAMAYDTPVSGYQVDTVATLRLWSARATRDFDLMHFNEGNYIESVRTKTLTETLSRVLYPMDSTLMGQELRLKQEYFFVSASLQDIVHRYVRTGDSLDVLGDHITIQLNDTHPALAVPEMMRILIDEYEYEWDKAWEITTSVFAYTNHTLLAEALETWPIEQMERILPRHMEIIYHINFEFLKQVRDAFKNDLDALRRMSIIDDANKRVRMAHLAIVGSYKVNGVAALHSQILRDKVFNDFDRMTPGKIVNMTNGITPRRWILNANPELTELLTDKIGDKKWIRNLDDLKKIEKYATDAGFMEDFAKVKQTRKEILAKFLKERCDFDMDTTMMVDTQIKRIHEYKRQLLNVMQVIHRYNMIKDGQGDKLTPRTVIIAGKAAPGYYLAKKFIHLINNVAQTVNSDPDCKDLLRLVFVPNYNVSAAEILFPATELSEQISTAGTEASGTGNMKFALNGALTIGTLDGANVEIGEEVGDENIFIFGLKTPEVMALKEEGYNPWDIYNENEALKRVIDMIDGGYFAPDDPDRFKPIVDSILRGPDQYLLLKDFQSYVDCQMDVDEAYLDQKSWTTKAILNVARVGKFSSDRTIHSYAKDIWNVKTLLKK